MTAPVDPWQYAEPVADPQVISTHNLPGSAAWQRDGGAKGSSRPPRPVGRVSTVIAEQPWFRRATPERRQSIVDAAQNARQRAHDRRKRVKAHRDLADRLCRSLGYQRFSQWNGYVPPARVPGYGDDEWLPNTSPVRAELIAILREVVEREKAAQAAAEADEQDPAG